MLWTVLAGGFLLVNFHRVSTGVLSGAFAREFDATGTELGFLHASFFYIYAALQFPSGLVVDRFGSRRVVAVGLLLGAPGVGWLSERLGRRMPLMFAAALAFTVAYGVIFLTVTPSLAVVGLVLFVGNVTVGGNVLACAVVKERHAAAASGTVTGTINSIGYFGAPVFPAAMGAVLDAYWTGETVAGARIYTAFGSRIAFGIATLSGLLSLVCLTWFYRRYAREPVDGEPALDAEGGTDED